MIQKGASMTQKGPVKKPSSRLASLLALAVLMAPSLLGAATATHAGEITIGIPGGELIGIDNVTIPTDGSYEPNVTGPVRDRTDTIPALDQLRDRVLDGIDDGLAQIMEELESRNATPGAILPATKARVFEDHVDNGSRIGGVGPWLVSPNKKAPTLGGWRIAPTGGSDGSAAFTMTDPETGKYGTMDAFLVSPVIDLSAYPLSTGTLPNAPGLVFQLGEAYCAAVQGFTGENCRADGIESLCDTGVQIFNDANMCPVPVDQVDDPLKHLIVLLFRHRYNLVDGEDGAQVVLFDYDPMQGGKARLLTPMELLGSAPYSNNRINGLDGGHGFTGSSGGWNESAFDLTPWAGKKVWIGFRIGTGQRAGSDPDYFNPDNGAFASPTPYGWAIDDLEIHAPAHGQNLKVYSIDGPSFRYDSKDKLDRTVPGETTNVGATILNAGSNSTLANLTLSVDGLDERIVRTFSKELRAGETWSVSIPVVAPVQEGTNFTVSANVQRPPTAGSARVPEATPSDNAASRTFTASVVRRHEISIDPGAPIVDDNAAQTATVTVRNTGNVPIAVAADLWETYNATNATTGIRNIPSSVTHPRQETTLPAGGSVALNWTVTTSSRGPHLLVANVTGPGLPVLSRNATYHVHSSPPPAFAVGGEDPIVGEWDRYLSNAPVDAQDGYAWKAENATPGRTLRGLALPEVSGSGEYENLRLKARYFSGAPIRVDIVFANPVSAPVSGETDYTNPHVWTHTLPAPGRAERFPIATNRSWATYEVDVQLEERNGSIDLWSVRGLEVHVRTFPNARPIYLDDLRLTGVPAGKDEGWRRELVRITGDPADALTEVPAEPNNCTTLPGGVAANCWVRLTNASMRDVARNTLWRVSPGATYNGKPVVGLYSGEIGQDASDRLVSPVINLTAASDPVFFLDHAYQFQGFPNDQTSGMRPELNIRQIGIVEVQYLQDDGTWSRFHRVVPVGGHRSVLGFTDDGKPRATKSINGIWDDGVGFFQPSPCFPNYDSGDFCNGGGFFRNLNGTDYRWRQYLPTPYAEVSVFRLKDQLPGVDLTNRPIRIAIHATENDGQTDAVEPSKWRVLGLRVTPVSRFAIDGAAANLTLLTDYDWRSLGVAPGTVVPVNVTVRNDGLFREDFRVRLGHAPLGGSFKWEGYVAVGSLMPGEAKNVTLAWNVTNAQGRRHYNLTAEVAPALNTTFDENRFNDQTHLGQDQSLFAEKVRDAGLALQGFPLRGDKGVLRYLPVTVHNLGNVPLPNLTIERTIEYLHATGSSTLERVEFNFTRPFPPTPEPIALSLAAPGVRESQLTFTPDEYGTYLVTLRLKGDGARFLDATPTDNEARVFIEAVEPLVADSFEERIRWDTTHPDVWGEGPGFLSQSSLTAANRTTGLLPANLDASVVSPKLTLANARTAVVNFVARYDLEEGYDGVIVEVSPDNRTWHRVGLLDEMGRTGPLPGPLSASNPIAGDPTSRNATAFTGDSSDLPSNLEGWAPFSIDLSTVPGVGESVVFHDLAPPKATAVPLAPRKDDPKVLTAAWTVLDPADEANSRWEIRNEQYSFNERQPRFWSNMSKATGTVTLGREWNLTQLGVSRDSLIVVTWWDRRPGTKGSSWEGVGADYFFRANNLTYKPEVVGKADGDWYRLRAVLPENTSREDKLSVRFDMKSGPIFSAANTGWEVRGITVESVPALNGQPLPGAAPLKTLTGDENSTSEREAWFKWAHSSGWSWVTQRHPLPAAPWSGAQGTGPDGRPRDLWKLTLDEATRANVDARLVSPVVDLAQVGGGETFLRVVHKYDLRWDELVMNRGTRLTDNKYYQGGTVEIEVFNRTTGQWDAPRQLWAEGTGPTRDVIKRVRDHPSEGAPYPKTLADAGDTFERFPRRADQPVGASVTYLREFNFNASYAFSGLSTSVPGNADGWITSEFDLSPYRGERVRIVFHAWSGPNDAVGKVRHWTIADADVVGNIMSAKDVWLRFRLGTDGSLLPGTFSVDQFEVSGRRFTRSIGVQVDEKVDTLGILANGTVKARLQNHGPGVRENVALGVQIVPLPGTLPTLLPTVVGVSGTPSLAVKPAGYAAAFGPFRLGAAGADDSLRSLAFRIDANNTAGNYTVRLVLLESDGGAFTFSPAKDDVPGRAGREWTLAVEDTWRARLSQPAATPGTRSEAGPVAASAVATNVGTRSVNLSAVFSWTWNDNGTLAARSSVPPAGSTPIAVKPGASHAFAAPPVTLGPGNYTLTVELLNGSARFDPPVSSTLRYRVQRSDVMYQTSFENGFEGWTHDRPFSSIFMTTSESAAFGSRSMLMGVPQWLYDFGVRIEDWYGAQLYAGNLTSPILDGRGALPDASVTFWKKSSLRTFSDLYPEVRVLAQRVNAEGEPDAACPRVTLRPEPTQRLSERDADWTYVRVPLRVDDPACALVGARFTLTWQFLYPLEKSWQMDGVTVWSGSPHVEPDAREHLLSDGGRKEYVFRVENRGAALRDFTPEVALNQSRLTAEQLPWVNVTPSRLTLEPGQSAILTVRLDPPSSRSLFPQPLNVTVALRDALMPFVFNVTKVNLDFQPRDRPDLAALASIDGLPLGLARVNVEEGAPHEVGVLVSNLGLTPSKATDVLLRVVNASGGVEWEHRERIEPLLPVNDGGEATLVAATWKPTYGRRGNVTLQVSVDPDRRQVDYDRSNSDLSLPLAVTPLIRPDLVVDPRAMRIATPAGLRIHEAEPGQLVRISGVVRNDGLAEAKQVVVRIIAGSSVLKEDLVPTLKVGEAYQVATNQIAPANSTTYQIVALTPDLEILADNNAQALELPILPPELVVGLAEPELRLEPGLKRTVTLNVTNTAPYPTVANLSLGPGARFATLGVTRLALGPGETRPFTLSLAPGELEVAGEQLLPIVLETSEGVRTRRTLTLEIEARPAASAIPYLARGPPQDLRVELDVVNEGNVELRPAAVVRDAEGKVLGRHEMPAIPPGKSRFAAMTLDLPDFTAPGLLPASLSIEAGGTVLAQTPMPLEVKPWGRLLARAAPGELKDGRQDVAITVTYEGNAPTVRTPVVFNAPEGVVARYSVDSLALAPGDSRSLTLRIAAPRAAPNGLYLLQAGFLDPEEGTAEMLGNLTSIPLDLRRGKTELAAAQRLTAEAVGGSPVEYLAKVRNGGELDARNVAVDLYVDGALVDRQVVEALGAGETKEVRLSYVADSGRHAIVLAVDSHAPEGERPAAFAETLDVAKGAVEGVAGLSPVPMGGPLLLLAALGVAALALRRRGRDP